MKRIILSLGLVLVPLEGQTNEDRALRFLEQSLDRMNHIWYRVCKHVSKDEMGEDECKTLFEALEVRTPGRSEMATPKEDKQ